MVGVSEHQYKARDCHRIEFERWFNVMFIMDSSKNPNKKELLKLGQGEITVNEYEQKFCTLCYIVINMDMTNKSQRWQMFEYNILDKIKTLVVAGLHNEYNRCVENIRSTERSLPKPKPMEALVEVR